MAEQTETAHCVRMILAAKAQAYEEAISMLGMVKMFGSQALEPALTELRKKHTALTSSKPPVSG